MSERTAAVRLAQVLVIGSVVVALTSGTGHAAALPFSSVSPDTASFAAPPTPDKPAIPTAARAAAVQFMDVYFGREFKLSWTLLAPEAKRHISQSAWVKVHDTCQSSNPGERGVIKSVTIFGDTAIVTETITKASQKSGEIEAVFSYAKGHWSYSPSDLGIYQHGSAAGDIAAAKAAGFCSGRDDPML